MAPITTFAVVLPISPSFFTPSSTDQLCENTKHCNDYNQRAVLLLGINDSKEWSTNIGGLKSIAHASKPLHWQSANIRLTMG